VFPQRHQFKQRYETLASKARALAARLRSLFSGRGRSLVGQIQLLQLGLGIVVYLLAVTGVWWTANRLSEDYFYKQASEWLTKLDELGTPLYISNNQAEFARVEEYVSEFPEVALVRFYSAYDGQVIAEYNTRPIDEHIPSLDKTQLSELRAAESPYLFDRPAVGGSFIRASAPVWIRSIQSDGLLEFDLDAEKDEKLALIGFLEIGLDFTHYQGELVKNIALGSAIIALLLFISIAGGRQILKRALRPLSNLEKPLAKLANGEIDVSVESSGYKEIMAISDALNATVSALKQRDETLRRLADHDQLTGLVNRYRFTQTLEQEAARIAREGDNSALLFVDLDQFKLVNDTLGHAAGDRLLVQVADKLKACLREKDVLCRFGGDEFTILARNVTTESAADLAASIIKVMRDVHFVEARQIFNICCSIGITMIASDQFTPDELLTQADMACYNAKSQGRNCYSLFAPGTDDTQEITKYAGWSQKIKQAVANDGFILNYQPIVKLANGEPELYEVLLRMPDNGTVVSPLSFLPVAERFGLMLDIDHWVIRNAIKSLADFHNKGAHTKFCINLSGHIFEDPNLVHSIRDSLGEYGLSASSVVFEITEQVAIRYLDSANRSMCELMDMGCRFALDDFGTGFSSLTYIKRLPVDYIKIDGSFIENVSEDPIDQAMVKSIVAIAQTIGKETIAEYVQDAKSLKMLRKLGADYAQGYYIGEPATTLALPRSSKCSKK
jgi:diguanylate cyclase (GGDEF)-like protein